VQIIITFYYRPTRNNPYTSRTQQNKAAYETETVADGCAKRETWPDLPVHICEYGSEQISPAARSGPQNRFLLGALNTGIYISDTYIMKKKKTSIYILP